MSTVVSPIDAQRTWLERIMTSTIIGFVVRHDDGTLLQCVDGDPELRLALIEWQTQRIRELERSQRQPGLVAYCIDPGILLTDQGQAGDDEAFNEMARQMANAGTDLSTPSFPGS